jgi:hypothetical protein
MKSRRNRQSRALVMVGAAAFAASAMVACGNSVTVIGEGPAASGNATSSGSAGGATSDTVSTGPTDASAVTVAVASSSVTVAASSSTGSNPVCGNGIVEAGESCDAAGDTKKCPANCICPTCPKLFAKVVSNNKNPSVPGSGIALDWTYKGFSGAQAGKAMCQDVGADHICSYAEVVAADAKGELGGLPKNLTYWLHRTTNAESQLHPKKACNTDADCQFDDDAAAICDVATKLCVWKPGYGARCNDWTYSGDALADGEWFAVAGADPSPGGGVQQGTLSFHLAKSALYDGVTPPACQDPSKIGCAGKCGGAGPRAILCCNPPPVQACTCYSQCPGTCP